VSKWDGQFSAAAKPSSAQCPQGGPVGFGHSASLFGLQSLLRSRPSLSPVWVSCWWWWQQGSVAPWLRVWSTGDLSNHRKQLLTVWPVMY